MKTLAEAKLTGVKRALVRADLDVPFSPQGEILETYRLEALLPTLQFLLKNNVFPIICGHIGRPKGKVDPSLSTLRLIPFFESKVGKENFSLLENLRFDPREEDFLDSPGASQLAEDLASKANIYVNDAFATCHREDVSIALLPRKLPSYAGIRLQQEVETLSAVLESPQSPKIAIVGGAKSSKKEAIYSLASKFQKVLVVGKLQKTSEDPDVPNVFYPVDYLNDGFDIGLKTIEVYSPLISSAKIVVWAGPAGAYDQGYFEGSSWIARAIISSRAFSVVGGGDTISCLNQLSLLQEFNFVSTGGGAMLDFLSGKKLPGLAALSYYKA